MRVSQRLFIQFLVISLKADARKAEPVVLNFEIQRKFLKRSQTKIRRQIMCPICV